MINMQKQVQDIIKLVEEANTMITEIEETILKASNNYWILNTANIFSISGDLWSLVQSDIENQAYKVQRLLANKLDEYKGKENNYMNNNIKEIQELYKKEGEIQWRYEKGKRIQDEEVLLYKPYKMSMESSSIQPTFIQDKLNNLEKYMKFIHSPTKTKTFSPSPHYKSIWLKGEQDNQFWKELAVTFVEQRWNTETL